MAPIHRRNGEAVAYGYADVKLCDPKAFQKYQCPLCKHLIRNPIQTGRGELACQDCYSEGKRARDDGKCPIDGDLIELEFRDRRKEKDILALECFCYYDGCGWQGQLGNLEKHLEDCLYAPISCQLCHGDVSPSLLSAHLEDCTGLLKNGCPLTGCTFKPDTVEDLKHHLHKDVILHSYLQRATIIDLQDQMEKQSSSYEKLIKEKDEQQRAEVDAMKLQIADMAEMIRDVIDKQEKDTRISELEDRIKQLEANQLESSTDQTDSGNGTQNNREVERLSNEVMLISKNIADTDLRLQLFENTNYDGKLLWKIDNIDVRMNQAITGKVTALHSAPTFTEKCGYKFCARLYLNGDGIGRNKHVSLFFVLMRSEYDSLLEWPFTGKVSFKLINQKHGRTKDKEESFVPDRNSSSYARPQKEMNIASGCPQFIALDKFRNGGYIKDDCIFIEVNIKSSMNELLTRST